MQKKAYKKNLEPMLVTHVFPEFQAQEGYMRARVSPDVINLLTAVAHDNHVIFFYPSGMLDVTLFQ